MIFRHLLNMRSHPTWVRGLKLSISNSIRKLNGSHPTWVRGLKLRRKKKRYAFSKSHPTWVRGLKLPIFKLSLSTLSRTLRGCVD